MGHAPAQRDEVEARRARLSAGFEQRGLNAERCDLDGERFDQCLQRLQTDRIDLMQIHEVIRPDDPDRVFAPGGPRLQAEVWLKS